MNNTSFEPLPVLAAPGAGLPRAELLAARLLFRFRRWRSGREQAAAVIAAERERIGQLVHGITPATGSRPVLIRRLRGLEDSSRHWSVFMTLDHLRIVNDAVAGTMAMLLSGRVPPNAASTAAVKPDPGSDESTVSAFAAACDRLDRVAAEAADLHTAATHAHPWFGPLDAAGWHFMAGFHMTLHRKQLVCILAGL